MSHARLLIVFAVVGLAAGCGDSAPQKFNSPEAAFKAFQDAVNDEDWKTAANCMTTESQAMMADGLVLPRCSAPAATQRRKRKSHNSSKGTELTSMPSHPPVVRATARCPPRPRR